MNFDDFEDLENVHDIACRKAYTVSSIRTFTGYPGFPKWAKRIGAMNFYRKKDVDRWFDRRVDRRFKENKRHK